MILSNEQADRFYALFDLLMNYAPNWLAHNDPAYMQQLQLLQTSSASQGAAALKLIERVWASPQIIGEFIERNPAGLPQAALDQAEEWKQGIFGQFAVLQRPGHVAYFILEDYAFEVSGLETQISELLPGDFAFAQTVLLPFDDRIVFGGLLGSLPAQLEDEDEVARMQEFLEGRLQKAVAFDHVVKTAQDFAGSIAAVREARADREAAEKLQEQKRSIYEQLAQEL